MNSRIREDQSNVQAGFGSRPTRTITLEDTELDSKNNAALICERSRLEMYTRENSLASLRQSNFPRLDPSRQEMSPESSVDIKIYKTIRKKEKEKSRLLLLCVLEFDISSFLCCSCNFTGNDAETAE